MGIKITGMYHAGLIYDVGMNNGDDTAYYLSRGFRVLAIEANPVLVEQAAKRFEREIQAGRLTLLHIGVSDIEGELPFWICDTISEWSSFDEAIPARDGNPHHKIMVRCRRFRSILDEFGAPYYLKLDIEGSEIHCLRDLSATADLPNYISFERGDRSTEPLTILHELGYNGFKLISQIHHIPVQYPPVAAQSSYERALKFCESTNFLLRMCRKLGAREFLQRKLDQSRFRNGWFFPPGSSGPFAEDTAGKWQSFEEILETVSRANSARSAGELSIFWGTKEYSFWADFHAKHFACPQSASLAPCVVSRTNFDVLRNSLQNAGNSTLSAEG